MRTEGSREYQNHQKCTEVREDVQRIGNQVAEVGFEYFCPDYVRKNGVGVMEHNKLSLLDNRLQEPTPNLQSKQIVSLLQLNFDSSRIFNQHSKPFRTQSISTSKILKPILDKMLKYALKKHHLDFMAGWATEESTLVEVELGPVEDPLAWFFEEKDGAMEAVMEILAEGDDFQKITVR